MTVLERSELEASPLADLHTIANQIGIDGYRRLRKAQLIDAILRVDETPTGDEPVAEDREAAGEVLAEERDAAAKVLAEDRDAADKLPAEDPDAADKVPAEDRESRGEVLAEDREAAGGVHAADREAGELVAEDGEDRGRTSGRRRRFGRLRRTAETEETGESGQPVAESRPEEEPPEAAQEPVAQPRSRRRGAKVSAELEPDTDESTNAQADAKSQAPEETPPTGADPELAEGVVELLSNGSAFLRVDPPGTSDRDVYVSAAQVRRCELVPGDRVTGPVRRPRRSERYPSLVRVQTINGIPASEIASGPRYEELTAAFPDERLRLDSEDANLRTIDWLTPIGLGSRVVIAGPSQAGKSETLRRLLWTLADRHNLELSLVLVGIRPEEAADWRAGPVEPVEVLSFAAPQDAQGQAVERAIETAKRVAARGGNALVAIDTMDGLVPAVARKAMAAARNLTAAGSLTVIATARAPLGGETTVIALDPTLTATGRLPALDLAHSGTLRPELIVGEDGAQAIREARVAAIAG
jgi:transcription termination factor Rho